MVPAGPIGFLFTWKSPEYRWFHLCTKKAIAANKSKAKITVTTIIHVTDESSSSSSSLLLARFFERTESVVVSLGPEAKGIVCPI